MRTSRVLPYLVLLQAGFTVPRAVTSRAVRSYRTFSPLPGKPGGIFSVALSMGSRPPGVTWRPVRRSPDFPLQANAYSDCLVDSDFLGRRILHVRRRLMGHWVLIYPNGSQAALYFE